MYSLSVAAEVDRPMALVVALAVILKHHRVFLMLALTQSPLEQAVLEALQEQVLMIESGAMVVHRK